MYMYIYVYTYIYTAVSNGQLDSCLRRTTGQLSPTDNWTDGTVQLSVGDKVEDKMSSWRGWRAALISRRMPSLMC
jgi:hypothetical protein